MKTVPSSFHAPNHSQASFASSQSSESPNNCGSTCVSFIDVGKGDCILIQSGGAATLVDTGYEKTSERVVSYLRNRGVSRLEYVVISHYDRDHIEGIRAIGNAFPIGSVLLPGYEGSDKNYRTLVKAIEDLGLPAQQVAEARSFDLGDAKLAVYPSPVKYNPNADGNEGNDNDLSLIATLTSKNDSYLFTGDIEEDGITAYLQGRRGQFGVLKMPHHGKKSSLTDELLDDVRPQIAVITDSSEDPADKKTLKLLAERNVGTYRSSTSGTVVVSSDGAGNYAVSCTRG